MAKKYKFVPYAELGMNVQNQGGVPIEAEQGEVYRSPSGVTLPIGGKKHEEGGTKFIAENNSEIFSDHLKPARVKGGKEFIKEHFGIKNTKVTFADIAKRYDTRKEFEVLQNKEMDEITRSSLLHNIEKKNKQLDTLFALQQSMNNNHSTDYMQDGGKPKRKVKDLIANKFKPGNEDHLSEDIIEMVDPTGLLSWDDAIRTWKDPNSTAFDKTVETLGALPLLGNLAKPFKAIKIGKRVLPAIKKIPNVLGSKSKLAKEMGVELVEEGSKKADEAKSWLDKTLDYMSGDRKVAKNKEKIEVRKYLKEQLKTTPSDPKYNVLKNKLQKEINATNPKKLLQEAVNTKRALNTVGYTALPNRITAGVKDIILDSEQTIPVQNNNVFETNIEAAEAEKKSSLPQTTNNSAPLNFNEATQPKNKPKAIEYQPIKNGKPVGRPVVVPKETTKFEQVELGPPETFNNGGLIQFDPGGKTFVPRSTYGEINKKNYEKSSVKKQKATAEKLKNFTDEQLQEIVKQGPNAKGYISSTLELALRKGRKEKKTSVEVDLPGYGKGSYDTGYISQLPLTPADGKDEIYPDIDPVPNLTPKTTVDKLPVPVPSPSPIVPAAKKGKPFKNELGFWDYAPLINANLAPKTTNYLGQTQTYDMMYNPVSLRSAKNDAAGLSRVMADNRFLSPSVSASRNAMASANLMQENSRLTENEYNMNSQMLTGVNQFNIQNRQGQQNIQQQFNKQFVDENNADLAARMQNQDLRMREFGNAVKTNRMQNRMLSMWDENLMKNMDFNMDANGNISISRNSNAVDFSKTGTQPFVNYDTAKAYFEDKEETRKQKVKKEKQNPDGSKSTEQDEVITKRRKGGKIKKGKFVW